MLYRSVSSRWSGPEKSREGKLTSFFRFQARAPLSKRREICVSVTAAGGGEKTVAISGGFASAILAVWHRPGVRTLTQRKAAADQATADYTAGGRVACMAGRASNTANQRARSG